MGMNALTTNVRGYSLKRGSSIQRPVFRALFLNIRGFSQIITKRTPTYAQHHADVLLQSSIPVLLCQ